MEIYINKSCLQINQLIYRLYVCFGVKFVEQAVELGAEILIRDS